MSKYVSNTVIQLEFLKIEEGETYLVTVPEDSDAEDIALIIRANLHQGGIVMNEIYIDHEFKLKEE